MRDYLGQKIDKPTANELLHTQENLKHIQIRGFLRDCIETNRIEIEKIKSGMTDVGKVFYYDQLNAYVFSKDDIFRFFFGDPDNSVQPSPTADYLMILLGTHPVDNAPYKKGDATVIIAGCNDISDGTKTRFQTLQAMDFPAAEHPQRDYKIDIDSKFEGDVIELQLVNKKGETN